MPTARNSVHPPAHPQPVVEPAKAILGTWDLVLDKSRFTPGPPPLAEARTYWRTPQGIQVSVVTTAANGSTESRTFRWRVDANEYRQQPRSVTLNRVNNLTAEGKSDHAGKVLYSERRDFSTDGKTLTFTIEDRSSDERPETITAVYRRR